MENTKQQEDSFIQVVKQDMIHFLSSTFYSKPKKITAIRFLQAFISPEFKVLFWYRIYNSLEKKGFNFLAFYLYQRTKRRYSCDLAPPAKIGKGFRIVHCSDIVIGPLVQIGTDTVIFNGVTLGNRKREGEKDSMPIVGNNVLLGTGAKLLGGISIGNNARIGANSVVLSSVPEYASAVGIPAKIIPAKNHS